MIISIGAVVLSVAAGHPAAYALARFTFPLKKRPRLRPHELPLRPFIAFVIRSNLIYQRLGLYNTHAG